MEAGTPRWPEARAQKFRQAAIAYLHVGLLYEASVWVIWQRGLMPPSRGFVGLWLGFGAVIVAFVVWGLWRWQHARFAQLIWLLHALRLPALIGGAFFADTARSIPPAFYLVALFIVLLNLWMLARAAFDV